jgi:Mor family transcriptional regulator
MIEAIIAEVLRSKVEGSLADELREAIIEALQQRAGGDTIYILKRQKIDQDQLRAEFNGRNIDDLCERFKITRQRVYQILNEN